MVGTTARSKLAGPWDLKQSAVGCKNHCLKYLTAVVLNESYVNDDILSAVGKAWR